MPAFFYSPMSVGRLNSRNRLFPVVFVLIAGLLLSAPAEKISAAPTVCFDAFVNWDFHHRQKLRGCKATAAVIQRTLKSWQLERSDYLLVENGTPDAFRQFLSTLPSENNCDINLVYLASHQSPAGAWDFTQKKLLLLSDILTETKIPAHPHRIVILDTCFAAALQPQPSWREKLAHTSLFASTSSERTPEINFHTPQPVDFAHRYPAVFAWLKECLGRKWDGKISFLGFVWVQTFLTTKAPPSNMNEWINFLQNCQSNGGRFRTEISKEASSELIVSVD